MVRACYAWILKYTKLKVISKTYAITGVKCHDFPLKKIVKGKIIIIGLMAFFFSNYIQCWLKKISPLTA